LLGNLMNSIQELPYHCSASVTTDLVNRQSFRTHTNIGVPPDGFPQNFVMKNITKTKWILLYSFFWALQWRLNFMCQSKGIIQKKIVTFIARRNLAVTNKIDFVPYKCRVTRTDNRRS